MVSRMAASTSGCRSNFPAIRAAARSKAVRTFRSGSGLALGPDWVAALACASRSFCRKSLTAWATAASRFARMLCRMLTAAASDQHQDESASGDQRPAVAARELAGAVSSGGRDRQHRFVLQVPPNVRSQIGGRTVAARPVLFESLQRDRVQVAAHLFGQRQRLGLPLASQFCRRGRVLRADLGARLRRVFLAQPPQEFVKCDFSQIERRHTRQQLVKNDTERVDIGARVDILTRRIWPAPDSCIPEFRQCAPNAREHRFRGQPLSQRLGHAEIDDLRRRPGHPPP